MRRAVALAVVGAAIVAGWSCIETCVPGRTEACACTDGRIGAQVCRSNGVFDPCICTSPLAPDAGVDAGDTLRCMTNRNPPQIFWSGRVAPSAGLSVAVGQPLRLTTETRDFDGDQLASEWSVLRDDAGVPGVTISALNDDARIELPGLGSYVVRLKVSDSCHEVTRDWELEVVPAIKLPFVVTDLACCDSAGRAFAIDGLRAQVMRLALDGGVDGTLMTPRLPRHLFLDANRTRLIVAQDAWVSFVGLSDFELDFEWPVASPVNAVIANDTQAWVYGENARGVLMTIDGGVLLATGNGSEPRVTRGFLSEDGGRMVIHEHSWVRSIPVASALMYVSQSNLESTCGSLWQVSERKRFVTGCGKAYEVGGDGGLAYVGSLRDMTNIDALGEGPTGELVTTWWDGTTGVRQLRVVSGASFGVQAEFPIGLWESELEEELEPRFLVLSAGRRIHVLTPDPGNDATWWQEF